MLTIVYIFILLSHGLLHVGSYSKIYLSKSLHSIGFNRYPKNYSTKPAHYNRSLQKSFVHPYVVTSSEIIDFLNEKLKINASSFHLPSCYD